MFCYRAGIWETWSNEIRFAKYIKIFQGDEIVEVVETILVVTDGAFLSDDDKIDITTAIETVAASLGLLVCQYLLAGGPHAHTWSFYKATIKIK